MKQSWALNEKTFIATSNARNEHMLKEAGDFATHLKHCERDIRALKNATEGEVVLHRISYAPPFGSYTTSTSVQDSLNVKCKMACLVLCKYGTRLRHCHALQVF